MTTWKIHVLFYGRVTLAKAAFTPGFDPDLVFDYPYMGYLLQDGKRNVLVDTGINDKFIIDGKAWAGAPADAGGKYVLESLAELGLTPEDIDTVLITHLHNDHAGNIDLFKDAKIICQKDEWLNLLNPLPAQMVRRDYDLDIIPVIRSMKHFYTVEGDVDVADGIKLIKTPGHTAGSQSVMVRTDEGDKVIVGDLFHLLCMAFPKSTEISDMEGRMHPITPAPDVYGPCIPSSLVYDYYAFYDSVYKLRSMLPDYKPEQIITGHDPSHFVKGVGGKVAGGKS